MSKMGLNVFWAAVEPVQLYPNVELIWASPRELLNVFQADAIGCGYPAVVLPGSVGTYMSIPWTPFACSGTMR